MDVEQIKKQVKEVISFSQNIENPKVDDLIDNWLIAKKPFIDAFGGKLIWETPGTVSFKLDPIDKTKKFEKFSEQMYQMYHNEDLYHFIETNSDTFFDNRVGESTTYQGKKIPSGMKLIKAFKYFEEDPIVLNEIQSEASRIIQEDKIEGVLCFSVHPLDFLSSSENTYKWRSCHSLDGEYRAGNLSYMGDSSTIVCYIKGADEVELPHFGSVLWNSKKWRALLYISDKRDFVAPGRQYPFSSISAINQAIDTFLKLMGKNPNGFNHLTDFCITDIGDPYCSCWLNSPHIWVNGRLIAKADIIKDSGYLHYNDLLRSSCYRMQYKSAFDIGKELPRINVGSHVKCVCCGKQEITSNDTMMCDKCEYDFGEGENDTYAYCDCCGTRFYREDGAYVNDYDIVCPNCLDNNCFFCYNCGEFHYNEEKTYDPEMEEYICEECYNLRKSERKDYY